MITTSQDFVRIKYGIEIESAITFITTPVATSTWRMTKYAETTKKLPTILAGMSG